MGAAGLLSHWCLAQAFKLSDTTFVMPLQFTKLIWASASGYFFFAEIPDFIRRLIDLSHTVFYYIIVGVFF